MVKYVIFIVTICCYACASPRTTVVDNKGVTMQISFNQDSVQMNDSVLMTVVLNNPTAQDIVLDSCLRIRLSHDEKGFMFYDIPERISYLIYSEEREMLLSAQTQHIIKLKVCVIPEFFYRGKNRVYAVLQCNDYYDQHKKTIVRTRNKIYILSNAYEIDVTDKWYGRMDYGDSDPVSSQESHDGHNTLCELL